MEANSAGWGSAPAAEPERDSPAWIAIRDAKLAAWEASKVTLENAKADEMKLRKEFVDYSFDPTKREGTERIALHNGFEAKAVKKCNYVLVSRTEGVDVADAVDDALSKIEATGPEGVFIAKRLVKWTPELSISEMRKIETNPAIKSILDTVLEIRDGAPTLEIVAPKGTKK